MKIPKKWVNIILLAVLFVVLVISTASFSGDGAIAESIFKPKSATEKIHDLPEHIKKDGNLKCDIKLNSSTETTFDDLVWILMGSKVDNEYQASMIIDGDTYNYVKMSEHDLVVLFVGLIKEYRDMNALASEIGKKCKVIILGDYFTEEEFIIIDETNIADYEQIGDTQVDAD